MPRRLGAEGKPSCQPRSTGPLHWLTVHGAQPAQPAERRRPACRCSGWWPVTGVTGSGKSTLARDVLLTNVAAWSASASTKAGREAHGCGPDARRWWAAKAVWALKAIDRVLEVDQTPIGKTPRSCPATYIGFWDTIRKLFADTLEAKARGYGAGRFSFNTGEGRCPACEGQGMRTIDMSFLPDVKVPCETCHGARFNPETLAVTWRGKNIGDVLQMEVDEAVEFFASMPSHRPPAATAARTWAWATSRWASPRPRSQRRRGPAHQAGDRADQGARRHQPSAARRRRTRCTCWTSPPWACTWPTWTSSSACCTAWWTAATA